MNAKLRHALNAVSHTTPGRREAIKQAAENYLSQIDRLRLPVGYSEPIRNDRANRIDAYRMRQGGLLARMLGLAVEPDDEQLPSIARAVIAEAGQPRVEAEGWLFIAAMLLSRQTVHGQLAAA